MVDDNYGQVEQAGAPGRGGKPGRMLACDACRRAGHEDDMFVCGRCKVAVYCSKGCQRGAWRTHKALCSLVGQPET